MGPERYCIIGAGAAGLTTAKNFRDRGIAFDCLEQSAGIGGLWNDATPGSAVYKTTHMVSSKRLSHFVGFDMPAAYPDYPSHRQVMDYFHGYADRFDLMRSIQLNSSVVRVELGTAGWTVQVAGEDAARLYKGVVVANGHHNKPHWPKFAGSFSGETVHARDCKSSDRMDGKRVLVIGCGNSGCDIAADAAQTASLVLHSMRRGYHIIPKYIFGRPSDVLVDRFERWPLPQSVQYALCQRMLAILNGPFDRLGLQTPDHKLFEAHPVISQIYPHYVAHGKIRPMLNIARFDGNTVHFEDGQVQDVDLIVFATGYEISAPFLGASVLFSDDGAVKPLMNIFHPEFENLFFVGLIQVNGGAGWPVMDRQAQLIASYIAGALDHGQRGQWLRHVRDEGLAFRRKSYVKSQRHTIEVSRTRYHKALSRLQATLT